MGLYNPRTLQLLAQAIAVAALGGFGGCIVNGQVLEGLYGRIRSCKQIMGLELVQRPPFHQDPNHI